MTENTISMEAEMSALGSMILSKYACEEVLSLLTRDDFGLQSHQLIFDAIRKLSYAGTAIDLVTLADELVQSGDLDRIGGEDYLIEIAEQVPSPANSAHYAGIVSDKSTLRKLLSAAKRIEYMVSDPGEATVQERIDASLSAINDATERKDDKGFSRVNSLIQGLIDDLGLIASGDSSLTGNPTGFPDLDLKLNGLYPGELTIIAGRPSMGKTTFAIDIGSHLARTKGTVALFSQEMGHGQIIRRMVSSAGRFPYQSLGKKDFVESHKEEWQAACDVVYDLPMEIDDTSAVSCLDIRAKVRKLQQKHTVSLVMIDHLGLMTRPKNAQNEHLAMGQLTSGCKALAKDLKVPVVLLCQLNRGVEQRTNKRPMLSDLRESGSIEENADVVLMLYRDDYYKERETPSYEAPKIQVCEVSIAKHRNGDTGSVLLGFDAESMRFVSLSRFDQDNYRSFHK